MISVLMRPYILFYRKILHLSKQPMNASIKCFPELTGQAVHQYNKARGCVFSGSSQDRYINKMQLKH
jgi:hypothetical protein